MQIFYKQHMGIEYPGANGLPAYSLPRCAETIKGRAYALPCLPSCRLRLGDDVFLAVHLQTFYVLNGALAICSERAIVVVNLGVVIFDTTIVQRFGRTFTCALWGEIRVARIMHACLCESFPLKREWRTAFRAMGQAVPPLIAFTASGTLWRNPIKDHRKELTVLD